MSTKDEKYVLEITKKLDSFKNASEWPDFISLLASLDTSIQAYALPYIPKKELLCKRLNQCLNPLLPAGVHKKVLETYSIIFQTISEDELVDNFGIYTLGLLNFGCHSRILVMGSYLRVIDKYIIGLGKRIEPFTINILFGLLPSIESESNEYYRKSTDIINKFKEKISEKVFYLSFWNIFLQSGSSRLSVISYLMNEKINYDVMVSDKILIVKALREGLKSSDLLILRNTLDLILYMFPIKSKVFSDNLNSDLLEGMFQIFSRREQNLNKRVFLWIGLIDDQPNADVSIITKTLERILKTKSMTQYFFKIFTTLSDKSNLTQKILEELLFEVLVYTKDYEDCKPSEFPILDRNKEYTQQDIVDIGKNFFTTDVDKLWKVFYIELKKSFKRMNPLDLGNIESSIITSKLDPFNISSTERNDQNLYNMKDASFSQTNFDKRKNSDLPNQSKDDNSIDLIKLQIRNSRSPISNSQINRFVSGTLNKIVVDDDQTVISDSKKKNKKKQIKPKNTSTEISRTPSDVLSYINFCTRHYNIYDHTVLKTHLPILVLFVLENYNLLDENIRFEFLSHNIPKINLVEQSEKICEHFFDLIDDFYMNENAKILKEIETSYLALITQYLLMYLDEKTYFISLDFYHNHKNSYRLDFFVKKYFDFMITKSLSMIQNSIILFEDTNKLNGDMLFKELWYRFCIGNPASEGNYGQMWNLQRTDLSNLSIGLQTNDSLTMLEDKSKTSLAIANTIHKDDGVSIANKKQIVVLMYEYNRIFKRKYEKILVKKVNETNKQNLCLFLYFILELQDNDSFYFYNIFFLINSKISGRDPMITSMIKSINSFKGVFCYTVKKFLESDIESENYIYVDKPNISQIKGILKVFKNILHLSRRFRYELNSDMTDYDVEKMSKIIGRHEGNLKSILFNILNYLFLCDMSSNVSPNYSRQSDSFESFRNIKIQSIRLVEFLIENDILSNRDLVALDLSRIVDICMKYKNDSVLVLPCGKLLKLAGNTEILSRYSSILDSSCFFYCDLLEIIFGLKVDHTRVILPLFLDNLKEEGYSFMIINEVVREMIKLNCTSFNWASINKTLIQKFIRFFNTKYFRGFNLDPCSLPNDEAQSFTNFDYHIQNLKVRAIIEASELLFRTFSGYYIEYLINSDFSVDYLRCLTFKKNLYANILTSYSINQDRSFVFLMKFDSVCSQSEKLEFYRNSLSNLYQIINYRSFTDANTLLYLLKVFSVLPEESSQFLSIIYQSLAHMQRSNMSKSSKAIIIDFLCVISYTSKIKSALQTFIGYLFELLRSSDKAFKCYIIDKIIQLSNNESVTIKNMNREIVEYLNNPDFFQFKLKEKAYLYRKIFEIKLDVMDDLVYKLESSFFVSQTSDINNKCNVLKRISFLIFANEYNKFGGFNSKFIEICVTLIQHSSIKVRKKIWFLIKIICLKINHAKLVALFPVVFTEILSFLNNTRSIDDVEMSCIVRVLDLLFLLNSTFTFEFKNILLGIQFLDKSNQIDQASISSKTFDTNSPLISDDLNTVPLFYKVYQRLIINNDKPPKRKFQISGTKKLFFMQKMLKKEDILLFFKCASSYYSLQEKKTCSIDYESLERYILNEITD
ncbi:hypothetical protein P3W45_000688 [Vairimorpha bombi]